MLLELGCLATLLGCGKRLHSIHTGKIYKSRPIQLPADPNVRTDFDETLRIIRDNRRRRDAGEYIPNDTDERIRKNLRRRLKPEIVAQMKREGRL